MFMNPRIICAIVLLSSAQILSAKSLSWPMFGGGSAHTSVVGVSLGNSAPVLLWNQSFGAPVTYSTFVDGVLLVGQPSLQSSANVSIIDASTGQSIRTVSIGAAENLSPPVAIDEAMMFTQFVGPNEGLFLSAINLITGEQKWQGTGGAQWPSYPYGATPSVENGLIYAAGGEYNGMMYAYDLDTGALAFSTTVYPSGFGCDYWAPTVYKGRVFFNSAVGEATAGAFGEVDPLNGTVLWSTPIACDWDGYSTYWVPSIANDIALISWRQNGNNVGALSLNTHSVIWNHSCPHTSQPQSAFLDYSGANDGSFAYFACQNAVWAFNLQSGHKVRSYNCPDVCAGQPIITTDTLIISGNGSTYFFDLVSAKLKFTLPVSGMVALSDSTVFITNLSTGSISAYSF